MSKSHIDIIQKKRAELHEKRKKKDKIPDFKGRLTSKQVGGYVFPDHILEGDHITVTDNGDGTVTITATQLTEEEVQDYIAAFITAGNGIKATYDDPSDTYTLEIDFTEFTLDDLQAGTTNKHFTATKETKLAGIEDEAKDDQTAGEIKTLYESNADTNALTDAEKAILGFISVTQAVDLDQMETDIAALANGMVYKGDWDASAGSFPGGGSAQTGWFYYVSVGGTVDGVEFAVGDNIVATTGNASTATYAGNWSKHDQTDAVQSVVGLTGSISKASLLSALNVEDGATADQTDAEIETAYNNQVDIVSQAEAEAGTDTNVHRWTPERVKQAIEALATALSSTDDLPEGTDVERLYNQVGNVEESTHADRIDIGALQANIHGIYAGLLTNFILMHTRVGNNTTELDGGIGYNSEDGFYIWEGSEKKKFITGINIQKWEDGRPYLTFEDGEYRYWLHNGSSLENVDGVPRFYNMKEGTIGAIPVPLPRKAGGW